jgi:hypothetical protein
MNSTQYLVNCAGLYSDKIAKTFDLASDYEIIPFRLSLFLVPKCVRLGERWESAQDNICEVIVIENGPYP